MFGLYIHEPSEPGNRDLGVCEFSTSEREVFATSVAFWVRESHGTKELARRF